MEKRASGVLMPIFSLPGRYGIGCLSKEAYAFVDFLKDAGQSYWQILPVGPTSYGDSPYQPFSVHAGNPYYIDLEELIREGLLAREECDGAGLEEDDSCVNYGKQYRLRGLLLHKAYRRSHIRESEDFRRFCRENDWLDEYAFFMALKGLYRGKSLLEWPAEIRLRDSVALTKARKELEEEILYHKFLQYEFSRQWYALKSYANGKGISIIGDIPIYVSPDSVEVWSKPELFQLDDKRNMTAVAGCPPDGFSSAGQLWGNPLYRWEYHRETDYAWWVQRMKHCAKLFDVVRIDHFRGFDEYFSIPAGAQTATGGKWRRGPGIELFHRFEKEIPNLEVIAEDLGYITDSVRELVRETGYPNMKVLEFAFDSRDSSGKGNYLPYNYERNCVVYTGTHDNETLLGWLGSILPEEYWMVEDYVGLWTPDHREVARRLIRQALGSVADTCIIPMQDYLLLGNEARINIPSTSGGNWRWRADRKKMTASLAHDMMRLASIYGRI